MTLTVNAEQLTLASRSGVEVVPLVVVQTYTDRDAGTVDQTRYWTRTGRAVTYKWDGTNDQTFDPVIEFVSPISRGFNHLPDSDAYEIRDAIRLEVDGGPRAGVYLWRELLTENVIGARVTIASLLIDPTHTSHDLGLTSAVHVVRYRGEVTRLTDIQEQGTGFSLVCESPEAKLTSTVFVPGETGAYIPVILDETADISLVKTVSGWSGNGTGGTLTSTTEASEIRVLWTNNVAPIDYPGVVYLYLANQANRDQALFDSVTSPGANGAPEVDLTDATSLSVSGWSYTPTDWDRVFVSAPLVKFAIAVGYVRGFTKLVYTVADDWLVTDETRDLVTSDLAEWHIEYDETNPDQVISYVVFSDIASSSPTDKGDLMRFIMPNVTTLKGDVDAVFAPPTGAFSTLFDVSTVTFGTINYVRASTSVPVSNAAYTGNQVLVYSTATGGAGSDYPLFMGARFWVPGDSAADPLGDVEIEFRVVFPSGERAKVEYLKVESTCDQNAGSVYTRVKSASTPLHTAGGGMKIIHASDLLDDNTIRIKSPNVSGFGIYYVSVVAYYYEETTNKALAIDDINYRSISTLAGANNHPIDQADTIISDYVPGSPVSPDATTFATAKTNTPNISVTPDLSRYPTLGELLAAIGFASRTNFVYAETSTGTVVKAFAAESDYDFPAPVRAIGSEFDDLRLTLRPMTEIANSFGWSYDLVEGLDSTYSDNYRGSFSANALSNPYSPTIPDSDFTASEAAFGRREAIQIPIAMIRDEASALDVTGYYVKESLRGQVERYSCVVPFWLGYDLEPGDIVSILPAWETANQKVRVLRTVFDFDRNAVGLVLESVT